ncbi:Toxin YoeB [Leminorella richardii]|uniref:Putative mRNA interferase YoeB n=1 Tax=Leminorella richardii TaxID=158841 RepID=A0A2X4UZ13_9GAMM|nr:Toxin YoeB [Leminorella richardii]
MKIVFSSQPWGDYLYWQQMDKKILKRINELIKDIQRTPFEGIGKPEPLKHNLSGFCRAESRKSIGWCMTFPMITCLSLPAATTIDIKRSHTLAWLRLIISLTRLYEFIPLQTATRTPAPSTVDRRRRSAA